MNKKIFSVKGPKDGSVINMQYAQTSEEINELLEKFNQISAIKDSEDDSGDEAVIKIRVRRAKYDDFVKYSKEKGLLLPLKYIIKDLKSNSKSLSSDLLREIYPLKEKMKVMIHFLKQNSYKKEDLEKQGVDISLWKPNDKMPSGLYFGSVIYANTTLHEKLLAHYFKLLGKAFEYHGKKIASHADTYVGLERHLEVQAGALLEMFEMLVLLYQDNKIKAFVNSKDYQDAFDLVQYYSYFGSGRGISFRQIALILMHFIGEPNRY